MTLARERWCARAREAQSCRQSEAVELFHGVFGFHVDGSLSATGFLTEASHDAERQQRK
jgi:hypothetical protein